MIHGLMHFINSICKDYLRLRDDIVLNHAEQEIKLNHKKLSDYCLVLHYGQQVTAVWEKALTLHIRQFE